MDGRRDVRGKIMECGIFRSDKTRIKWDIKLETLNLLHVSSCEMFTFCDVIRETKQKNVNKFSTVRNRDWKSSLMNI